MFPISKREKRGKSWAIILLMVPLVMYLASIILQAYRGFFVQKPISSLLSLGILLAIWSLISFATYLGKRWAQILLLILLIGLAVAASFTFKVYFGNEATTPKVILALSVSILIYLLPSFLLFLPAPNAFLHYQREKSTRHLAVLEHQLNQIGKNESV